MRRREGIVTELQAAVRASIEAVGGMRELARRGGISSSHIHAIASGKKRPSPSLCRRIGLPESFGTRESGENWRLGVAASTRMSPGADPSATADFRAAVAARAAEERAANMPRPPKPAAKGKLTAKQELRDALRRERERRRWTVAGMVAEQGWARERTSSSGS